MVSFHLAFPPVTCIHSIFLINAIYHAHLILLDLIILSTRREEYNLCNSSLSSFFQPPATSSHLVSTTQVSVRPLFLELIVDTNVNLKEITP
jgi:hypothetical protein